MSAFNGKTAEQWYSAWLLEYNGRLQDHRERLLPLAWKRKCNGKLYGLVGTHIAFGRVMVWLYESGTNKALHLPLVTLARRYQAVEGFKAAQENKPIGSTGNPVDPKPKQ